MLTTEKLMKMTATQRQKAIFVEKVKCFSNYQYLIETYFTVDAGGTRKPFKLYPHQRESLVDYLTYQNNITMKTRQMGFTTFTSAFIAARLININNFKTLIISKEMGSSKDFVKNIKDILDNARNATRVSTDNDAPSWLIPEYAEGYNNKESFQLANGSQVKAQGNTEDAGRGISGLHLCVVDEVAYIDRKSPERMREIWAAVGPALSTVQGRSIMISTPFGSSGWYYDTYTNAKSMGFHIIDAHWTAHPVFNMGQYQWIKDDSHEKGGYLKFYNDKWPETLFDRETGTITKVAKETYPFVTDGNIRSPWYDAESKKLGTRKTACELDCSFVGTGGEVFPIEVLRRIKMEAENAVYNRPYVQGLMVNYKEFFPPRPGGKYVLAADVSTGDGSDFSTICVLDLITLQICATFKYQLLPNAFAKVIYEIGRRYGFCHVVVENAGGGGSTLQELKDMSYPNIYYSTLNKKDESIGVKKRKIGLWVSEEVRDKGGTKLEQYISEKSLNIVCTELSDEFYNWIWDKDGRRRHAPGKHDDLIMALQHAVYYHFYIFKRNNRNRENFSKNFAVQKNGVDGGGANGGGMYAMDGLDYNPMVAKRNNGVDIIDHKGKLANGNSPDDKIGGRRTVTFL